MLKDNAKEMNKNIDTMTYAKIRKEIQEKNEK